MKLEKVASRPRLSRFQPTLESLEQRIALAHNITIDLGGLTSIPAGASDFANTQDFTIAPSALNNATSTITLRATNTLMFDQPVTTLVGIDAQANGSLVVAQPISSARDISLTSTGDLLNVQASITGSNPSLSQALTLTGSPVQIQTVSGSAATTVLSSSHQSLNVVIQGNGSASIRYGVGISNAQINAGAGSIAITGTGYSATPFGDNIDWGVVIFGGSKIETTGAGPINIDGEYGLVTTIVVGTLIDGTGTLIQTVDGPISLKGEVAGKTLLNGGIVVNHAAVVQATGTGTISLQGSTPSGSRNKDIIVINGARVTAGGGDASKVIGLRPGSKLIVSLDGIPDTDHVDLYATGGVDLGGATLQGSGTSLIPGGTKLEIVQTDGTSPVVGTFTGGGLITIAGASYQVNSDGLLPPGFLLVRLHPTGAPIAPSIQGLDLSTDSGNVGDNITNFAKPQIDGNAAPGSTVKVFVYGTAVASVLTNPAGLWTYTFPNALANGTYPVQAITTNSVDSSDPSAPYSFTIVPSASVPPLITVENSATLSEGQSFVAGGLIGSTSLVVTMTVDYGDGSGVQPLTLNPDRSFGLAHIYPSGGTFAAMVRAVDSAGQLTSSSIAVKVVNVAPTAQIVIAPIKFPKKGPAIYKGAGSDPGTGDALHYGWTVTVPTRATRKNKHPMPKVVATASGQDFSFSTRTRGTFTVTLTVTDNQGATGIASKTIKR